MTFANRLRQLREEADMTLEQLARKSELCEMTLRNYERGASVPSVQSLCLLAKAAASASKYSITAPIPMTSGSGRGGSEFEDSEHRPSNTTPTIGHCGRTSNSAGFGMITL
jgi:transcriptional regulator with XRE-family HTH domain